MKVPQRNINLAKMLFRASNELSQIAQRFSESYSPADHLDVVNITALLVNLLVDVRTAASAPIKVKGQRG